LYVSLDPRCSRSPCAYLGDSCQHRPYARLDAAGALRRASTVLFRYGLVVIIAWFGAFKFTPAEAQAIQPLVANSPLLSWLYAVTGEIVVGFGFLAHGAAKWSRGPDGFAKLLAHIGVPLPVPTAWMVTLVEVAGGVAILAGAFVVIVSVPLIASMLVALFTVHLRFGFSSVNTIGLGPAGPIFGPPGYEINLLYIGALVALALMGSGACSVDRWLLRRRSVPKEPS
jgi:putative oxidoreductase